MYQLTKTIICFCFLLLTNFVFGQQYLSGYVRDAKTGEALVGAYVVDIATQSGTTTDENGYYNILLQGDTLRYSYIGYKSGFVKLGKKQIVTVLLEGDNSINEIIVSGRRKNSFNVSTLSNAQMLELPVLGGKPDVVQTLQYLPGIQTQTEGTSLMLVRGGSPGENLYLIDNIPLIYVNHLGGFTSVFNPDMINTIDVYKGGFPAKYGGKLSSVMAITQREGNKDKIKGNLSAGLTDLSFLVEGPIKTKNLTFLLSGRKSVYDIFLLGITSLSKGDDYYFFGFHDINGKISWKPDTKNSFYFNLYKGDDYMRYWSKKPKFTGDKFRGLNIWGNWLLSGRWSRIVNSRLFVNNVFSYTYFRNRLGTKYYEIEDEGSSKVKTNYISSVYDLSLRSDWKYKVTNDISIDFGAKLSSYKYHPNVVKREGVELSTGDVLRAYESVIYAEGNIKIFNRLSAVIGGRLVNYNSHGFNTVNFEPRINLVYEMSANHLLNCSFQQVEQNSHLLQTKGDVFMNEVWVPASQQIMPSESKQFTLGWKSFLYDNSYVVELNAYYKELLKLATYKEGYTNMLGDGSWMNKVETNGSGESKGVELLVKKTKGEWKGFVAYTFARTTRQFDGINRGLEYVFDYDIPHSLSINVSKKINEKWKANAVWTFQSGMPFTPVVGRQLNHSLQEILLFGERNSARMKNNHHLDISAIYKTRTKKDRRAEWCFSVYNAYCHLNSNLYIYNTKKSLDMVPASFGGKYEPYNLYNVSFFPIIPTASYKVFFE